MDNSIKTKLAPFGIRHELAKRYTPLDWYKARKVARAIDAENADRNIADLLRKSAPGLVGRLGGTEARFLGEYKKLKRFQKIGIPLEVSSIFSPRWKKRKLEAFTNAGFYSNSWTEVEQFWSEYESALSNTDILGAWGVAFTWVEGIVLKSGRTKVIPVGYTAPWVEPYEENGSTIKPWSAALEGKKVLVISGFAESIASQHRKAESLFDECEYPSFVLSTIKAPITSGRADVTGRSWFENLESMKAEIDKLDFDVALIAAGAYSYPLANYVKVSGKIGIHCGGGLQIFFGIMGNRWNNSPEVLRHVNSSWTRPSKDETPPQAHLIEGACYW